MKVLFTHSYFLKKDFKQLRAGSPYPPLATLYAAALLREHGFEVSLADLQFSSPENIEAFILNFKPDVFVVYDDSFNYLTKMCLTNMRDASFEMQRIAHAYNIPVVVSSSDATDHLEKYFDKGTDFIIIGEGEETLLELLRAFKNNEQRNVDHINGLAYRKGDITRKTKPRAVLKDLDQLPSPAWDLVNIKPYRDMWMQHHGFFSINFVTTRGCPYKCNWCAKPVYGNRYNSHSAKRIANEINVLQKKFGFTHIWFADDIFGLKPGWLHEFSKHMRIHPIDVRYKIQSRADLLMDENTIRDLKESGCDEIWIGAESGSQKILDAMDKGTTVQQIVDACNLMRQFKIKPCLFLQFGYPGEALEDIKKTISMLMSLKPHDIGVSVSYPLPGTKFYENVKSHLSEKQNWTDSDDLQVMFQTTYTTVFYKHLQRFVHYRFRLSQAMESIKSGRPIKKIILVAYYAFRQFAILRKLKKLEPRAVELKS